MKRLLAVILWLVLASVSVFPASANLSWDPKPSTESWTQIRIYEHTGSTYTLVGTSTCNTTCPTQITIPNVLVGIHNYVARSFNGQQESPDSNEVSTAILSTPVPPGHLSITVTVP